MLAYEATAANHASSLSRSHDGAAHQTTLRAPILLGVAAITFSIGSLIAWSCSTSIASATIVPGVIVVDSGRKDVAHLTGGIIQSINVRDDQDVVAGQTLATLDATTYDIAVDSLKALLALNTAQQIRLGCEQDNCSSLKFPKHIGLLDDLHWQEAQLEQQRLFAARHASLQNRVEDSRTDGSAALAVARSIHTQIQDEQLRVDLTQQELRTAELLATDGYGTRQRVIEVARAAAELRGELSELIVRREDALRGAAHEKLEVVHLQSAFLENAGADLQQAQREHAELLARLKTELQQRDQCIIKAPVTGRVVNLAIHTIGGVASPGASLLEIVPVKDALVLEAKVSPNDIENISPGLAADIRLAGLIGQRMPRLVGHVTNVSADRLEDQQQGKPFFRVRVEVPKVNLAGFGSFEIRPGVAVTLMIRKGEQTPVAYLLSPLVNFFTQALR